MMEAEQDYSWILKAAKLRWPGISSATRIMQIDRQAIEIHPLVVGEYYGIHLSFNSAISTVEVHPLVVTKTEILRGNVTIEVDHDIGSGVFVGYDAELDLLAVEIKEWDPITGEPYEKRRADINER